MNSIKMFQLEKDNATIRKTVLTNIIKMLTERKLLNVDDLDKNINKIINTVPDDNLYKITLNDGTEFMVKIFGYKIASISKQSIISTFLSTQKDTPMIIVVENIGPKASQFISTNFPHVEVFLEHELMINLVDNILVPKYEPIRKTDADYPIFFESHKKRHLPIMNITGPIARYYNLKRYDLVRIIIPSENSGIAPFYRIVV